MSRYILIGSVAFLVLSTIPSPSLAQDFPPRPSIPHRVALAETIVVGKVTRIEGQSVMLAETPGAKEKKECFIAIVHIKETIKGADGLTDIKVAFPVQDNRVGPYKFFPLFRLHEDQTACLFLKPHHAGECLIAVSEFACIDQMEHDFENDRKWAHQCAKLLADPEKGLRSKDADQRFLTAAMLIIQYRTQLAASKGHAKQVPIDATQSRLILQVLAEVNWKKPIEDVGEEMWPQNLFSRLSLTGNDGWNQSLKPEAAKKWLLENSGKHRIKKFCD
jgi:hypothetical protein